MDLCVSLDLQSEQRLFYFTTLIVFFVMGARSVFCEVESSF